MQNDLREAVARALGERRGHPVPWPTDYHDTDAVLAALSTTPARAEAQDEGAAGEPVASGCGYSGYEFGGGYPDSTCIDGYLWDLDSSEDDGGLTHGGDIPCPKCNAHPSPTPAADDDADRARMVIESSDAEWLKDLLLDSMDQAPSACEEHCPNDHDARIMRILAALKSTAMTHRDEINAVDDNAAYASELISALKSTAAKEGGE